MIGRRKVALLDGAMVFARAGLRKRRLLLPRSIPTLGPMIDHPLQGRVALIIGVMDVIQLDSRYLKPARTCAISGAD